MDRRGRGGRLYGQNGRGRGRGRRGGGGAFPRGLALNHQAERHPGGPNAYHGQRRRDHHRERPPFGPNRRNERRYDHSEIKAIGYKRLEEMFEKESPDNIVISLGNCNSGLEQLLRGDRGKIDNGMTQMMLKVFGKMMDYEGQVNEFLIQVLKLIMEYDFLTTISDFTFGLLTESHQRRRERAPKHVENALKVAKCLLTVIPKESQKKVSMMLILLKSVMEGLGGMVDVEPLYYEVDEMRRDMESESKRKKEQYKERMNGPLINLHEQPPPDNFRDIPVFPQLRDIQADAQPFIRGNLTDRAYNDIDHYLDVQYRLLREDFIKPLRDGIQEIKSFGDNQIKKHRFENVKVYEEVKVLFAKPDQKGILHRIQFSTAKLKNIRWKNTKRLLFGNLLCFSSDQYQNDVLFAVVADRKPEDLEEGHLTVSFVYDENDNEEEVLNENDFDSDDEMDIAGAYGHPAQQLRRPARSVDLKKMYTMVETDAYFEAYRHVLAGLRDTTTIPLQRYIVNCSEDMYAPEYLRPLFGGRISYDFSPITNKSRMVHVLGTGWPSPIELSLNQSQAEALKLALTNELAIIQGPPGTGKTHVGLEIMKILLANKNQWAKQRADAGVVPSPILIVCYTNHALDQFLEGISKFCGDDKVIVRVGGRSKNEVTQKFSLHKIRQERRKHPVRNEGNKAVRKAIWDTKNALKMLEGKLMVNTNRLEASLHCIQKLDLLRNQIPQRLLMQFGKTTIDFFGRMIKESSDESLLDWLGLRRKKDGIDIEQELKKISKHSCKFLKMLGHTEEEIARAFYLTGNDDAAELHKTICNYPQIRFPQLTEQEQQESENDDDETKEEADFVQDQRLLDPDEIRSAGSQINSEKEIKQLMNEMAAMTFKDIGEHDVIEEDDEGWQQTRQDKKKAKQLIRRQLGKTSVMSDIEESSVHNIFDLNMEDRWRLYRTWVNRWRDQFLIGSDVDIVKYNNLAKQLERLRRNEDAEILQSADVVAVTTTGAAKYRDLIYKMKTRIVVVEEAAEVLEAHIITAMPQTTQHLILIGDHQQLKPSPTVYELAKRYNLDTSLFERLMKVRIPHVTLNIQHRMRPEIADLLRPRIYKDLQDHRSVENRGDVTGVQKSVFFIDHDVYEEIVKDGKTKQNLHEVDFLVSLCKYLLMQGYQPEQITILAMYTGQIFAFKNKMRQVLCKGVRVTAVDNFQGEENDIILLSLVRSNQEGNIGFLKTENRICVALSRAKLALYCIGNMTLMSQGSAMWRKMCGHLVEFDSIGESLMLQCKNHSDRLTPVKSEADFVLVPEGGCGQPCGTRLDCGHVCPRLCHPENHSKTRCRRPCKKTLDCGHVCQKICSNPCEPCYQMTDKVIPSCGHQMKVRCCDDPITVTCTVKIKVDVPCGHSVQVECHASHRADERKCRVKCNIMFDCFHACRGDCYTCYQGRLHRPCSKPCDRVLVCGHQCKSSCSTCPPCAQKCMTRCLHSSCRKKCGQPCVPCKEKCLWKCKHYQCMRLCSEPCDRPPCNEPCDKHLKCGHPCIGLCGEPCPTLCRFCDKKAVTEIFFGDEEEEDARFVMLEDCNHVFTYTGLDVWMNQKEEGNAIKMKECPKCKTPVWRSTRYGNVINKLLESVNRVKSKIWGDAILAKSNSNKLIKEIEAEHDETKRQYRSEIDDILKKLKDNPIPGQIIVFEKQLTRMQRMAQLKKARNSLSTDRFASSIALSIFDRDCKMIVSWIMLERHQDTELDDKSFEAESERMKKILKFVELNAQFRRKQDLLAANYLKVKELFHELEENLLNEFMPFGSVRRLTVKRLFRDIKEQAPELLSNLKITESERKMICKAMGFAAKGHWYTCPNGHIYAIGDCGGATMTSTCPACRAEIGGSGHRLLPSNRIATEMDGATRPAYDVEMDRNYVPDRLLRQLNREGFH